MTPDSPERDEKTIKHLASMCTHPGCKEGRMEHVRKALLKAREEGKKEGARLNPDVKAVLCFEAGLEEGRADGLKSAAAFARDFSWKLPVYATKNLNEVTDDVACAVCEQVADGILALSAYRQSEAETKERA